MHCDPCLNKNVEKNAVVHCEECNGSFCEPCKEFHGNLKIGKTHNLRNISSIPSQRERKYLDQLKACSCSTQALKPVEYFCKDHGVFCCRKCQFNKHRKCDNVDEVDHLVSKASDKKFDAPLDVLEQKIQELTEIATVNNKLAEESYTDVKQRLVNAKKDIDDAYDMLKTKILGNAKSRRDALVNEMQKQNQNIETLSMMLNEKKTLAETVNKHGHEIDKHIFNYQLQHTSLKEMKTLNSKVRSALIPRQFMIREKHNIEELVMKLTDALEIVDKEVITGSDSSQDPAVVLPESITVDFLQSGVVRFLMASVYYNSRMVNCLSEVYGDPIWTQDVNGAYVMKIRCTVNPNLHGARSIVRTWKEKCVQGLRSFVIDNYVVSNNIHIPTEFWQSVIEHLNHKKIPDPDYVVVISKWRSSRIVVKQNQNIETLSMKLNEQKTLAETVSKHGHELDKHIFSYKFKQLVLKEMNTAERKIKSSLMPRQFTNKERHSIEDITKKLKDALDVTDKELVTGSDRESRLSNDVDFIERSTGSESELNSRL